MKGYPLKELFEEVAYLSYYFHWPYDQVMRLEHRERHLWIEQIGWIHARLARETGKGRTEF